MKKKKKNGETAGGRTRAPPECSSSKILLETVKLRNLKKKNWNLKKKRKKKKKKKKRKDIDNLALDLATTDTNPVKKTNETRIQERPKDCLELDLDGNLDPLLIMKQEPWYNDDATINYGWIDW